MNKEFISLLKEIRTLYERKDMAKLKGILNELPGVDVADVIEILEPEKQVVAFRLLSKDKALDVFEHIEVEVQQDLLQNFADESARDIFEQLEPDDRIRLMDELPAGVASKLLESLSQQERDLTALLLGYDAGSAGRIMTPKYIRLDKDLTSQEALARVRTVGGEMETIYNLYVTDEQRKLRGAVSLRDLIMAEPQDKIDDIMESNPYAVHTDTADEDVANYLKDSDLLAVPVIDHEDRLVGVITVDDAIDVLEEEATDAAFDKAGMIDMSERETDRSKVLVSGKVWQVWRVRIPFLLVTLAGGMIAGGLIEQFEEALATMAAVAFFIPVIMDMGGNVGTQSSTIFTRAVVLGQINFTRFLRHWGREILIGLSMGAILGLLGGGIAAVWQNSFQLGVVISLALSLTITIATSLGYLVPFVLMKLGFDQAAGSDPFITTIKDISGLLIYFLLVSWMLI